MSLSLIKLSKEYQKQCTEMIEEWKIDQEVNKTNHSPWAIFKNDVKNFEFYIANLDDKGTDDGKVPSSTFFLYDDERNRFIGAVNIRHYLNDKLLVSGGHIGDGIRPTERRKGYATLMISMALLECKKIGIDRVLMCCDSDNIGSKKSIINNGGILENIIESDGKKVERYWINLK